MLTQHCKRVLAARPDKPQYPDEVRKMTVVRPMLVRPDAKDFIVKYEYLGKLGGATRAAYGLFTPWGELLGVECFGVLPGGGLAQRMSPTDPSKVVCLERGACVPWAPNGAAGRAIKYAIEQAHRDHGWEVVIAYADENVGEIGGVYRGDSIERGNEKGWYYLGRDVGRGGHPYREAVIRPGETAPKSTRNTRKAGFRTRDQAMKAGWQFVLESAKHVFVRFVGPRAAERRRRTVQEFGLLKFPTRIEASEATA